MALRITTSREPEVCAGCRARHHERCNGWTSIYLRGKRRALALKPCMCARCGEADRPGA